MALLALLGSHPQNCMAAKIFAAACAALLDCGALMGYKQGLLPRHIIIITCARRSAPANDINGPTNERASPIVEKTATPTI